VEGGLEAMAEVATPSPGAAWPGPRHQVLWAPRGSLMCDGCVIFSPSSWEPQEERMMNIAARFFPQLRNQGMSIRRGRSQTTEGDAC
jgi:hypothetical protein